ncbi:hypothetical protein [Streptomyces sp. NPDC001787]|uniref:hypothetical protein n=1 Tax=Streptomyces sp. NPDC001787 TaxID=3154523 RepID=UPI0033276976
MAPGGHGSVCRANASDSAGRSCLPRSGSLWRLLARVADPSLWARTDDPRLDPIRESENVTVVNCASAAGGPPSVIETMGFRTEGELLITYRKQYLFEHEQDAFISPSVSCGTRP